MQRITIPRMAAASAAFTVIDINTACTMAAVLATKLTPSVWLILLAVAVAAATLLQGKPAVDIAVAN